MSSKTPSQTTNAIAIRESGGGGGGPGHTTETRSLHSAGGGRRPVKVWNAARTIRKALVVATYEEFHRKGREKVGLSPSEPIRVVLEGDGTQVNTTQIIKMYHFQRILLPISLKIPRSQVIFVRLFSQVDDGEYFQTLPENTIFLFLRPGEIWRPAGTDAIRSGKQQDK